MKNIKFTFKSKKFLIIFSFFLLFFLFFSSKNILASNPDIFGTSEIDKNLLLESGDPRAMATRVINIFLGLLSIIAVSLVIYSGFIWMTSEGNEEKISKAKSLLKNASIGLAIILSAWGITLFVLSRLSDATQGGEDITTSSGTSFQLGTGALGNCSVESVYPQPDQKLVARNSVIMINFKEEVDLDSLSSANVSICEESLFDKDKKKCSKPVTFKVTTNDKKTFILSPETLLGNENGLSNYIVYFSSNVLKADKSASIFSTCSTDFFAWGFEVSNFLDLTPPKIENIFPQSDNLKDNVDVDQSTELKFSTAFLTVISQPKVFESATVLFINPSAPGQKAEVDPNYDGEYTQFSVVIDVNKTKAQLRSGGVSLGAFDIANNEVIFTNYFKLTLKPDFVAGESLNVKIKKRILADNITIGNSVYTFVSSETSGYNIQSTNNPVQVAQEIVKALSSHPNVIASNSSAIVNLTAKVGGLAGNNIVLSSSNENNISVNGFSGGMDKIDVISINDKKDKPMNSVVQISFNEVINPLFVSGSSDEVKNYIRVVNSSSGAKNNNQDCVNDKDCKSFKCQNLKCSKNQLSGNFIISADYKTVEFRTDNECGVNGCGEKIYCLPAESNIKVELVTASLFNCEDRDSYCSNKSPFSSCVNNICTDSKNSKRYPLSDLSLMNGIMDSASNSFDGNSDGYSFGPTTYFNKNNPNPLTGDNFTWSFWINNKIETDPPVITSIFPDIKATSASLISPIKIDFNKLMMNSTLKTGEVEMKNDNKSIFHRLINLISGQLVGYWISSENNDVDPLDGELDKTTAYVNHIQFFEGADYKSQAGSGVKDIYQNCFKPSSGPGIDSGNCIATPIFPFCCDGISSQNPCE